jgi:hypothetical protein
MEGMDRLSDFLHESEVEESKAWDKIRCLSCLSSSSIIRPLSHFHSVIVLDHHTLSLDSTRPRLVTHTHDARMKVLLVASVLCLAVALVLADPLSEVDSSSILSENEALQADSQSHTDTRPTSDRSRDLRGIRALHGSLYLHGSPDLRGIDRRDHLCSTDIAAAAFAHTVLVWWVVYTARIPVGRTRHVHRFELWWND